MAKNDLDFLIDDINYLINNHAQIINLDDLVVAGLEAIGVEQIQDTNTSRAIFVEIAREYFGREIGYIMNGDTPNTWGNLELGRTPYSSHADVNIDRLFGLTVDIEIDDEGVVGQEYYGTSEAETDYIYPSPKNPNRSFFEPNHITRVMEQIDSGLIPKFEYYLDRIENLFVEIIEGRG